MAKKSASPKKESKKKKSKKEKKGKNNPVKVMDTTLRDGHQSLLATRMRIEDMVPILDDMNKVGFHALEVWGGATFDSATRFLNEDPWERLAIMKKHLPDTNTSMLLRGQNLVGYRHYADDLIEPFVVQAAETGMDIFRVFDALNDERNMVSSYKAIKKTGKHIQGTVCYTLTERHLGGPVYNIDYYIEKAKIMEDMGADSLCIKDMAGILAPLDAYELIGTLKSKIKIPIQLHCHYTSGMASMTYLKAIEAGVDIIDTALAPFGLRTSQPAIEPIQVTLEGTDRDPELDLELMTKCGAFLERIAPKYRNILDDTKMAVIDAGVLLHQIPGGMMSNLVNQLREAGALDKLPEVLEELPRTRADLGYPPLVTPSSQIVGTQSVMNVLFGRYEKITQPVKDYMAGLYGRPPVKVNKDVQKKCLKDHKFKKPIKGRTADHLEPELEAAKEAVKDISTDMKDVLIYALYPVTGMQFLKWKYGLESPPDDVRAITLEEATTCQELVQKAKTGEVVEIGDAPEMSESSRTFNVLVNNEYFEVQVDPLDGGMMVSAPAAPAAAPAQSAAPAPAKKAAAPKKPDICAAGGVLAPMPGVIIDYKVKEGDTVNAGDVVLILEAMKMENEIKAEDSGTVTAAIFKKGDKVDKGELLLTIG
jgi:pyruvate carboxylase subunit B